MNPLLLPWLGLSVLVPLLGGVAVGLIRDPYRARRWCLVLSGLTFICTFLAWLGFFLRLDPTSFWQLTTGPDALPLFAIDELNAPMIPMVALLHFLTALATARTKAQRSSFSWLLICDAIGLATLACVEPWGLVGLLVAGTLPPFADLVRRNRPTRVYVLHMSLFVVLLVSGWTLVDPDAPAQSPLAAALLLGAILLRCGTFPVHCWVVDLFDNASFGNALLALVPLTGVYAAARLVVPIADDWVLQGIGMMSLVTAVYAAGMAVVQTDARRFFCYLLLSHSSLVLVGLERHTPLSTTGALCLWFSVMMSLGGLGLTLRALEARFGRLTLDRFHGLYAHAPALGVAFMLTGLAAVGFPGTVGFISAELLVDGVVGANLYLGLGVVLAGAINGLALVRAYLRLFTGCKPSASIALDVTWRERLAVVTLALLILGGGLFPQPGVASRHTAAEELLGLRELQRSGLEAIGRPGVLQGRTRGQVAEQHPLTH